MTVVGTIEDELGRAEFCISMAEYETGENSFRGRLKPRIQTSPSSVSHAPAWQPVDQRPALGSLSEVDRQRQMARMPPTLREVWLSEQSQEPIASSTRRRYAGWAVSMRASTQNTHSPVGLPWESHGTSLPVPCCQRHGGCAPPAVFYCCLACPDAT